LSKRVRKVAVIGCGRIASHHANSIHDIPEFKLAGFCDLTEEKAAKYGKEFDVPFYTNYRKMLTEIPDIDLVVIATPSGMHFEHAMEILTDFRKSVIVEKPTFMKPSQLSEAYETADKLGLKIYPVFQNRYNKAVCRVKEAVRSGELGNPRICAVRVRWCRPQRYYDLAPWRGTYSQDGGALTNQGIHHVDLLRMLGGEVVDVQATMRTLGANIEVEDTAVATLTFKSGAVGVVEVTTAARPDDFEASISLVCENGLAQIGGIAVNELQVFSPKPGDCKPHSEDFSGNIYGKGHAVLYRDIAADDRGERPYPVSREDALRTIQLLHAFYCSAERGGVRVSLEEQPESTKLGRSDAKLAAIYQTPR
jgi:predicted dehydrogenase